MRHFALSLLTAAVLLAAFAVARDTRAPREAPEAPIRAGATGARTDALPAPAHRNLPPAPAAPRPPHEVLADRARNGDAGAALELARLLEACEERSETSGMMTIIGQDWGPAPACTDADECAAQDQVFDELQDSLWRSRASASSCRSVPRDWLARRGRWLERAAALGDPEARACYALVGVELAPQAYDATALLWLEQWRRQALSWAWDAWRRGEPRAALALARIYAPAPGFAGDVRLADPDPARAYRFALLLERLIDLGQGAEDLAQLTAQAAGLMSPRELAEGEVWVQAELPRVARRMGAASRTPNRCWQHFAVFDPPAAAGFAAAR